MSHTYDDVRGLDDDDLIREITFAEAAEIEGDPLTQGWTDHLRAEQERRGL